MIPSISAKAFECPYCKAYAHQSWFKARVEYIENQAPELPANHQELNEDIVNISNDLAGKIKKLHIISNNPHISQSNVMSEDVNFLTTRELPFVFVASFYNCQMITIWVKDKLVWPRPHQGPAPHPDLPQQLRRDYDEAVAIIDVSPRASAALSRLLIQKLLTLLGETASNLNEAIGNLVKSGLDVKLQRALDVVRVIGNNAVHPGVINIEDDKETARVLCEIINIIIDDLISKPKKIEHMYNNLPQSAREQIRRRDSKDGTEI